MAARHLWKLLGGHRLPRGILRSFASTGNAKSRSTTTSPAREIIDPRAQTYPFHIRVERANGDHSLSCCPAIPTTGRPSKIGSRTSTQPGEVILDSGSPHQTQHANLRVLPILAEGRSRRPTGLAGLLAPAVPRLVPRFRRIHDGGSPATLGLRRAICHRLHPDGRRTAWSDPRLDGNLHSRGRLAGFRSNQQQTRRLRARLGRRWLANTTR